MTHIILPIMLPDLKGYITLEAVIGPFFLAQHFNWCLYGILCLQVYIYVLRFRKDFIYIKCLVAIVFVLDTFSTALITHAAWNVFVSRWGDVNILCGLPWTWASVPIGTGVISGIVQMFFVWRIWKLSQSFIMPVIITLVILGQVGLAIRIGFIAAEPFKSFSYVGSRLLLLWVGGSMLADILISISLGRILWARCTGFKDTDSFIMRLIRLSVEAAAVPVVAHASEIIFIYTAYDTKHFVFCIVLARLYSNTLLAMLNCRDELFGGAARLNTMAGAARRSDNTGGKTFLQHLVDKFTARRHGPVDSRSVHTAVVHVSQGHSIDNSILRDKILVIKHAVHYDVNSIDIDPEAGVELHHHSTQNTFDNFTDFTNPTFDNFPSTPNPHHSTASPRSHPLSRQPAIEDETKARIYDAHSQCPPVFYPDDSPPIPPSTRQALARPDQTYSGPHN